MLIKSNNHSFVPARWCDADAEHTPKLRARRGEGVRRPASMLSPSSFSPSSSPSCMCSPVSRQHQRTLWWRHKLAACRQQWLGTDVAVRLWWPPDAVPTLWGNKMSQASASMCDSSSCHVLATKATLCQMSCRHRSDELAHKAPATATRQREKAHLDGGQPASTLLHSFTWSTTLALQTTLHQHHCT